MAHLHDSGYKYLFSHAELCKSCWKPSPRRAVSELLDYTTLRLESGNHVTPAMKPRADDLVWSVELQGGGFISICCWSFNPPRRHHADAHAAHVAALYDHLLRSKAVDIADGLPPVLPIVLYNGDARWRQKQRAVFIDPPASTRAQTVSAAAEILAAGRSASPPPSWKTCSG